MADVKKYVKGGAINPRYVIEEQADAETQFVIQRTFDVAYYTEMGTNKAKLDFLQQHAGSQEEYELAKAILGIQN